MILNQFLLLLTAVLTTLQAAAGVGKAKEHGRGGKGPGPEDHIQNTGPSGKEALPGWMAEADKKVGRWRAGAGNRAP